MTSLSRAIEKLFTEIIGILKTRGLEYLHFYRRAANQIVEEMNELLQECTGGLVPDYARFYREAPRIFDKGYSHRLCKEIAKVTKEFLESSKELPDTNDILAKLNSNDKKFKLSLEKSRRDFQKYKLLIGLIGQMRNPARSIFEKALSLNQETTR